jgi:uncharacterized protein (DUF1330 family)
MPAYVVAEIEVTDPTSYDAYRAQTSGVIRQYGGRFVVRGGATQSLEGAPPQRVVVVEFADADAARRFYESPEYQKILKIRQGASKGRVYIVDGAAT